MSEPYPATLPLPDSNGYRSDGRLGVDVTAYRPGPLAVNRRFNRGRSEFRFTFILRDQAELATWLDWVRQYAWISAGILIDLVSFSTTAADDGRSPHEIRFVGPLAYTFTPAGSITVEVDAEVISGGLGQLDLTGAYYDAGNPVDGGTPAAPSAAAGGPVDGGTPAAPSGAAGSPINAGRPAQAFGS